jgi:hypothetical protein
MRNRKYFKLNDWFLQHPSSPQILTFEKIEEILGEKLPDKAITRISWWGNKDDRRYTQCRAWLKAGFQAEPIGDRRVRFLKTRKALTPE